MTQRWIGVGAGMHRGREGDRVEKEWGEAREGSPFRPRVKKAEKTKKSFEFGVKLNSIKHSLIVYKGT